MKNLKDYITEGQNFLVNKKLQNRQDKYEYHPKDWNDLIYIIYELLNKGITDLNCIDVSEITDMNSLFSEINAEYYITEIDISEWDVSNVTDMSYMFADCTKFNSDLSKWNVSNVQWFTCMFRGCKEFNSDLSNWKVRPNIKSKYMFDKCTTLEKNNKIPSWYSN